MYYTSFSSILCYFPKNDNLSLKVELFRILAFDFEVVKGQKCNNSFWNGAQRDEQY